jgi:hypothetical protein
MIFRLDENYELCDRRKREHQLILFANYLEYLILN